MTLAQFLDYVRFRHNEGSSGAYWTDPEIYQLITARCNEILSVIGLLEGTDVATTTVAGTGTYSWPTYASAIKALLYDGQLLQQISFREWEQRKAAGTTPQGQPESYVCWNRQVIIIPTPNDAKVLTYYIEKSHPYIDNVVQTTIDIPTELHFRLADGVLCDMAVKDLNMQMASFYETKWNSVHKAEFARWKARERRRGRYALTQDSDIGIQTDYGLS